MDSSDSENEYWRCVSPVHLDVLTTGAGDTDVEDEAPANTKDKRPVRQRVDDTPRPQRAAAGPSRQAGAQAAPSPTKTLSQSMRNLSIIPFAPNRGNQPRTATSSAQLAPPDSPIMPGALPKTLNLPNITLTDDSAVASGSGPRGLSLTASGFLPYPSLSPEMRARPLKPKNGTLSAESSFRSDGDSSMLSPTSTVSFLPSRDTRDNYDDLLKDAFAGADKHIIAHHLKVKELDNRRIGYGVQLELARGVQRGRWTWSDVTPSRMNLLRGPHVKVMPDMTKIMDCGHGHVHDPTHHAKLLWEEFDREQAAILENKGRGIGLLSGTFEGVEDWFGGRIQIIVRLDRPGSSQPPTFVLEPPEMKRSYALARELGSRRLLVLKTAPPPPADAAQKRKHYEPALELFARKFVLMGRVFIPFDAKDGHVYAVETDEDYERDPVPDMGDDLRQPFWEFIKRHNPLALNYRQPLSKWATRLDLGLSTSIPALEFDEDKIEYIEDVVPEGVKPGSNVPTEQKMTDGIGYMNGSALSAIARRIHLADRPGAVQGRIAGSKGLWLLHPTDRSLDEPPRIWIRRSQQKIILHELTRADRIFALVQPSRVFTPGHLGMQPILNMAHNGVPASAFENLMETSLRAEVEPYTEWTRPHAMALLWAAVVRAGSVPSIRLRRILPNGTARAMGLAGRLDAERSYLASGGTVDTVIETESQSDVVELDPKFKVVVPGERGRGPPDNLHETAMELIQAGFTPQESGYLYGKVRYIVKTVVEGYVSRYRILVPRSAEAYIVADPFGLLAEDEVHFRSSKELGDPLVESDPFLVTGEVLISRYPTTVASDIRKAKAVAHPLYESYVNMIILPTTGSRSFASWLGGGDYDGDTAMITWEPTLVEPFKNAPLVEPTADFIEKNFDSRAMTVQEFVTRMQSDRGALGSVLLETLLSGMRDRRVGLYARFHDLAIWRLGYGHPATERLAHMFVTCLDANKTGLRTLENVFRADDLAWKLHHLPACMAPQVKGAYAGFTQGGPFILDHLRSRGQALENELLRAYDQLGLKIMRDDSLLEPAHRAELFSRRMQRDLKTDLWVKDLDRLRDFVDSVRKEWPSAASSSPRKPRSAEDRTASINALARRFEHDAPQLNSFAMYSAVELAALRASLAYAVRPLGDEQFAFAVAFTDLCRIKANTTDAAFIVRSLADVLTMQRSTRAALGGNVVNP